LFGFTAETPRSQRGNCFDLVVRGHQIKSHQPFRLIYGRRPEGFWRIGLSPILQKKSIFSQRPLRLERVPLNGDEWAVKNWYL